MRFRNFGASWPSPEVYNAALDAYEKGLDSTPPAGFVLSGASWILCASAGGEWQGALCLLWEMLEAGFKADLVSYSTVSSACDKGSAWKSALQIFTELSPRLLRADLLIYRTRAAVMFVLCRMHTLFPGPSQKACS